MASIPTGVHVLYATATGTAEDVSQQLAQQLVERGAQLKSLSAIDEYPLANLPSDASRGEKFIFVVSTCGDGHVPITMRKFWTFIRRSNLPPTILWEVQFAIFGLGDKAYVKFNAAARKLCTRLIDLGASLITPLALGDDSEQGGYDAQLLPWTEKVLDILTPNYNSALAVGSENTPRIQVRRLGRQTEDSRVVWLPGEARAKPTMAAFPLHDSIADRLEVLTNPNVLTDDKEVFHVQLDVSGCAPETGLLTYEPGDIVHVMPRNSESAVEAFLELTGFDGDEILDVSVRQSKRQFGLYHFNIEMPCSLRQLAAVQLDLTATPRRRFFKQLAPFATLDMERAKLLHFASKEGTEDLTQYAYREKRTILLVLRDFPSARPPLESLIDVIPLLRPRAFSIASSAEAHPGLIHICVSMVKYKTPLRFMRVGVCSGFLKSLSEGDCVPIFLEKGTSLRFNKKRPAVLIGPGTGVAPMRSFLSAEKSPEFSRLLFFGCRVKEGDFLYQKDFALFVSDGRLAELITAFSRSDPSRKTYVQHKMEAHGEQLWDLIHHKGAYLYLAGAAGAMPKAVRQVLVDISKKLGKLGEESSELYVRRMEAEGRLQMECW
ncbi:NADPH-dependent diflavin oxidoreductase NDOR [Gracilaria domingensis]|nr:NADPH-dependent diflavin oxidoreductase NDOR [Gracilaria domingensis]